MKRLNARDAFADEPALVAGKAGPREDDEAVLLDVRGGQVTAAVRAGAAVERALVDASMVRAVLRLENEQILTVQIQKRQGQAALHHAPADLADHGEAPVRPGPRTAEEIMTREVLTTSPDLLVEDVAKLLAFHNISGLPVEDWDGRIIGIVTEADVIGKIGDTIRDVMSAEVVSVALTTPIQEIAALLAERQIKRVPVIEADELVGIVSRGDIVRALAAQT